MLQNVADLHSDPAILCKDEVAHVSDLGSHLQSRYINCIKKILFVQSHDVKHFYCNQMSFGKTVHNDSIEWILFLHN